MLVTGRGRGTVVTTHPLWQSLRCLLQLRVAVAGLVAVHEGALAGRVCVDVDEQRDLGVGRRQRVVVAAVVVVWWWKCWWKC